jgi:hypothetical protein
VILLVYGSASVLQTNDMRHLGDRRYEGSTKFRAFKRQLYHASVAAVLRPLHAGMKNLVVRRCPDRHFRHVVYDLIAFVADYPEQVMLTGIVQGWCPR